MFAMTPRTTGRVQLTADTVADVQASPTASEVSISCQSNGALVFTGNLAPANPSDEWWSRQPITGIGAPYEVRLTVTVGDAPTAGSATATWLALSTTRTWTWNTGAGPSSKSATATLEIRNATTTTVLASVAMTITADSVV